VEHPEGNSLSDCSLSDLEMLKAVVSIEDIVPSFRSSFVLKNSNGSSISFWKDAWCDSGIRLMDLFPRLYALKTNKECKVCDRWCLCNGVWGGIWSWRIPLRGRPIDDLVKMADILGNLFFLRMVLTNGLGVVMCLVNVCVWRASINRLATRSNLAARGILATWRKIWSWWHLDNPSLFPSFPSKILLCTTSILVVAIGLKM
ncbi:hypothetical protein Tco_1487217, partial [Tanacetum coccineum]